MPIEEIRDQEGRVVARIPYDVRPGEILYTPAMESIQQHWVDRMLSRLRTGDEARIMAMLYERQPPRTEPVRTYLPERLAEPCDDDRQQARRDRRRPAREEWIAPLPMPAATRPSSGFWRPNNSSSIWPWRAWASQATPLFQSLQSL